jgi:hypothetical protein
VNYFIDFFPEMAKISVRFCHGGKIHVEDHRDTLICRYARWTGRGRCRGGTAHGHGQGRTEEVEEEKQSPRHQEHQGKIRFSAQSTRLLVPWRLGGLKTPAFAEGKYQLVVLVF